MTGCLPVLFSLWGVKPHTVVFTPGPNLVAVEVKQRKHESEEPPAQSISAYRADQSGL